MDEKKHDKEIQVLFENLKSYIEKKEKDLKIIRVVGKGGFGFVVQVKYKGQSLAGKLIRNKIYDENTLIHYVQSITGQLIGDETELIKEFRGTNIVKITKIIDNIKIKDINNTIQTCHFIIMEYAELKDLRYLIDDLYKKNKLKLIVKSPFGGEVSDNLIRFLSYEIIKGLESLDRKEYYHFDIKPDNLLIFKGLIPKISDLRAKNQLKEKDKKVEIPKNEFEKDEKVRIPGGTPGYLSPEYYQDNYVSSEVVKKQDYFALGAVIFKLQYGEDLIRGQKYPNDITTSNYLIDLIQRGIDLINSKEFLDKDFKDFLCSLIKYKPEERPDFEEIYRNKWLNKNIDIISRCHMINNYHDEDKLLMELNKSDFINDTKNRLKKNRKKFIFKTQI